MMASYGLYTSTYKVSNINVESLLVCLSAIDGREYASKKKRTETAIDLWMASNRLIFNINKSVAMLIGSSQKDKEKSITLSVNGKKLKHVLCQISWYHYRYHLIWDDNVNYILKRAFRKITMINRLKLVSPKVDLLNLLYHAYILPIFEYCDTDNLSLTAAVCGHQRGS